MYISNVKKNVIFFFSRFFLKKRRENIFSGKNFKKKEVVKIPFSPLSLPFLPPLSKE